MGKKWKKKKDLEKIAVQKIKVHEGSQSSLSQLHSQQGPGRQTGYPLSVFWVSVSCRRLRG